MKVSCLKSAMFLLVAAALGVLGGSVPTARAQVQSGDKCENNQSVTCQIDSECPSSNGIAMMCVDRTCQPSCDSGHGTHVRSIQRSGTAANASPSRDASITVMHRSR